MLKENYKLRKLKIGLVSIGMGAIFAVSNGTAEASEATSQETINDTVVAENEKQPTPEPSAQDSNAKSIQLDEVRPGATQISGYTQPNQSISVKIDNRDVVSLEDFEEVLSDDTGKFTYDLKGRKIVYNQKIDVEATEPLNLEDLEDDEEVQDDGLENDLTGMKEALSNIPQVKVPTTDGEVDAVDEMEQGDSEAVESKVDLEDEAVASTSYITPRYDKAYVTPKGRLLPLPQQHQVWIEPVLAGSGVIKGHTSVNGKVALAINQQHINLGDSPRALEQLTDQAWAQRYDGIWRYIDDKGFFEFELNRIFGKTYTLKQGDQVTLSFKSEDEDAMPGHVVFNVMTVPFEDVAKATTVYRLSDRLAVQHLEYPGKDLEIAPIFGDVTETALRAEQKLLKAGTKKIEGRTKYANAVVQMASNLGEYRSFPTLQVSETGRFIFDLKSADIQLLNGETLTFTVINPHNQQVLAETQMEIIPADEMPNGANVEMTDSVRPGHSKMTIPTLGTLQPRGIEKAVQPLEMNTVDKSVKSQQESDRMDGTETHADGEAHVAGQSSKLVQPDNQDQWESSVDEADLEDDELLSMWEEMGIPAPEMAIYGQRMPLLQLMRNEGRQSMPPFALRVNKEEKDKKVEKREAIKKEKRSVSTPPQLPNTGEQATLSMWPVLMIGLGAVLLLQRRRSR
ncbi:LPXTG cell wall anchor domain-containing protein [Staphylococcus lutrae]|uniref:YSIRK signal domain/LPXTG anchor domain surface protein n=1 Tax=Staphylococcus lutrae TaxID=155085 RepID=A0AAC9RPB3_9STAP|nr:LPXTG cell wall anchor domain-containing protein [Staphylococcus lutrae]ARJ50976.1 hypothetical protein B5P37_06405 [Staphylococcus lutrae]PNZ38533.1 YSIRK signal domain/LPXTG anchor domain surface protein [Staphylococcus lutrae]